MIDDKLKSLYIRLGLELPSHDEHGIYDRDRISRVDTRNWVMIAPGVIQAETSEGPLTVNVPNDLICKGTDEKGLPILEKINL